jgi:hypothetical protein
MLRWPPDEERADPVGDWLGSLKGDWLAGSTSARDNPSHPQDQAFRDRGDAIAAAMERHAASQRPSSPAKDYGASEELMMRRPVAFATWRAHALAVSGTIGWLLLQPSAPRRRLWRGA